MAELEDTPQSDPEEAQAREDGWVPQDEWQERGKDPEEWVSAARFNARGEVMKEIKNYRSQVQNLESKVSNFGELMTEQVKATREAALQEAEKRHRQAVEDGDTEEATRALREVKDISSQPAPQQDNPENAFNNFLDSRPDIRNDFDKFKEFRELDQFVALRNNGVQDMTAHLNEVARLLDEKRPEPRNEETPGRTAQTRDPSKVSYRDLPDYAKSICDDAVAKGLMSQQEYVDSFVEAGGMSE